MCNISQHLADYSIIIQPFAFVFFAVGNMYIERFTNGRFSMLNFYQPRIRQSDRWARLANNNYLNSPKDYVKLVKLSGVCILVRIPLDLFKLLSVGILFRSTEFDSEV